MTAAKAGAIKRTLRRVSWGLVAMLAAYSASAVLWWRFHPKDASEQTWILFVTGLGLVWYSWETRLLRLAARDQIRVAERQGEAMVRQNALQLRPYLVISGVPSGSNGLRLRNIGAGTAINVRIDEATLMPEISGGGKHVLRFSPSHLSYIEPGREGEFEVAGYVNGKPVGDFLAGHLVPDFASATTGVTIRWSDVEGSPYEVTHEVRPKELWLGGVRPALSD